MRLLRHWCARSLVLVIYHTDERADERDDGRAAGRAVGHADGHADGQAEVAAPAGSGNASAEVRKEALCDVGGGSFFDGVIGFGANGVVSLVQTCA